MLLLCRGLISFVNNFSFNLQTLLRRSTSVMANVEEFCVCFPDKTVWFSRTNDKEEIGQHEQPTRNKTTTRSALREKLNTCFIENDNTEVILIECESENLGGSEVENYVRSCLDLHPLFRSSKSNPRFCFGLSKMRADQRNILYGCRLRRLLCCAFSGDEHLSKLINTQREKKQQIYKIDTTNSNNEFCLTSQNSQIEPENVRTFWKLSNNGQNGPVSPLFENRNKSPVFHDMDKSLEILNMVGSMEEVQELLKIYNEFECARETTADLEIKFPFVAVEGLDGAGKTTITGILQKKLEAELYCTPPPILEHLRKHFTSLPEIIARAYYQVGNYIVARQILEECQSKAVIMDRYWHSTAAYGIANETSLTDMPPEGHCTYNWPPSLLKPSIVLFLSVTEETRQKRMTNRHGETTFEEKALESDIVFRKRLNEAYKRFVNPACVEIDANGSVDSVVEKTLIALKEHGIELQ